MKRQRMNNSGFTLIETTVAMLVMMIVGLSASSLFLYSVRNNSGASQRSVAMAVAQQRLEVLRGAEYEDAGLAFGTYTPETVVIAPGTTTTGYAQGANYDGGQQTYDAPASASGKAGDFTPFAAPTPTPTPTTGGGTTTGSTSAPGSNTFQIQKEVVPYPIGTSAASATQKQITLRVVPVNGSGNSHWSNQNPVVLVFRRSVGSLGPYKL